MISSLLKVMAENPRMTAALAGIAGGGLYGYKKGRDARANEPDGLLLGALEPGAKDHLDEALRLKGYPFSGADLRRIAKS